MHQICVYPCSCFVIVTLVTTISETCWQPLTLNWYTDFDISLMAHYNWVDHITVCFHCNYEKKGVTHVWALRLKNPSSEALKKKFLFLDEVNIIFRDCMERHGMHSVSLYLWCIVDTSKLSGKPDEILGELAWFLLGESGNTKSQLHVTEEFGIGHQVKTNFLQRKKELWTYPKRSPKDF